MKRLLFVALTMIAALSLTFSVAWAGNIFNDLTSTISGYPTWDSDMINIEAIKQTGAGV